LAEELREVMRASAQPVAIITTYMARDPSSASGAASQSRLVHGATLSSFTSVSLDPPLVTFSLRVPSRLADALVDISYSLHELSASDSEQAHFVINILSESQESIAKAFATPGLEPYSTGTRDASSETAHPLDLHETHPSRFASGVPFLADAVGALACRLVGVLDMRHGVSEVAWTPTKHMNGPEKLLLPRGSEGHTGSLLFIAHVCGIDKVHAREDDERTRPMVYWQRNF
ncbi:hypothetical protein K437DRAFT_209424, partial [Tilletiaria anomala UBC 951]